LTVIEYNPDRTSGGDILHTVESEGVRAQLIGL
jgi:hypothetical protein